MLKPSVEVKLKDGVLVAEFWDCLRLDPSAVSDLRRETESHLSRDGRPELVVDLNGVGFAGSSALGGFLAIQRLCRQKGGRVVLCNVEPTVREVFRVSKLDSFFEFATDLPEALGRLNGAAPASGGTPARTPEAAPAPPPSAPPLRGRRKPS
jgi:stage II sporulation protein AA (anti-sigma F factor antagonist)